MADTTARRMPHGTRPLRQHEGQMNAPESYAGYALCDPRGRKVGSVAELFFNDFDEPEYVNVKVGLLGLKTVLIPVAGLSVDEERRTLTLQ